MKRQIARRIWAGRKELPPISYSPVSYDTLGDGDAVGEKLRLLIPSLPWAIP